MKYPILIQKDAQSDYGVVVPDLAGCFSAGQTVEEAIDNAQEAILTHVEGLLIDNDPVPAPTSIKDLKEHYRDKGSLWAIVEVDFSKLSKKMARVNISVPENLLSKIDLSPIRRTPDYAVVVQFLGGGYLKYHLTPEDATTTPLRARFSRSARRPFGLASFLC